MVWAAIAVGIGAVSFRAGLLLGFFGFFFVCLPRVYVGLHFATDVLVGWIIGMLIGWLSTRARIRDRLAAPFLRWEAANPGPFYAVAFMVTLHLAAMFWNIRQLAGRLLHASKSSDRVACVYGSQRVTYRGHSIPTKPPHNLQRQPVLPGVLRIQRMTVYEKGWVRDDK